MRLAQWGPLLHRQISDPDGLTSTSPGTSAVQGARRFHFPIGRATVRLRAQHVLG